jgi:tryptophan-rich sensory protein
MNELPWIDWYQSLAKPSWTPSPRTIGLIWQILYPVIIATIVEDDGILFDADSATADPE